MMLVPPCPLTLPAGPSCLDAVFCLAPSPDAPPATGPAGARSCSPPEAPPSSTCRRFHRPTSAATPVGSSVRPTREDRATSGPPPRPFGLPRHAGAYGVTLHIRQRPPGIRSLHRHRVVASLPQMSRRPAAHAKKTRIVGLKPAQHLGGRPLVGGNPNDVEMVRHQAVAPDREPVLPRVRAIRSRNTVRS